MKPFPDLRAVMAKYGLTSEDLAEVTGSCYATFNRKLNMKREFTFSEILAVTNYFRELGEDCTAESLFFNWKLRRKEGQASGYRA